MMDLKIIYIGSKFSSSIQDACSYMLADVGSDHQLCIAWTNLKLKKKQCQITGKYQT